nr:immunoglobulin light chain junction region [Macaca mulatta]
CQNGYGIPFTF